MPIDESCWTIDPQTGFILQPDPIADLRTVETGLSAEVVDELHELATSIPTLITDGELRRAVDEAGKHSMGHAIELGDGRVLERLFQIYAHLANGYVWCEQQNPTSHIPASVAVPLVELANALGRPPIIPYVSTSIANFKRIDPNGDIVVENLRCIQKMIDTMDETWFHMTHVQIEAEAGPAIAGCSSASTAAQLGDIDTVATELATVPAAIDQMTATFKRITERCRPEYYFRTLRPYLFGFTDVVYEGVEAFDGEPQTINGQTGAQSSVIPAIRTLLGVEHNEGGLTSYLVDMKQHMPRPHRDMLASIDSTAIRGAVVAANKTELTEAYNACLESVLSFRSLHLNMARAYIASKVDDPTGTGGTNFMHWLTLLRDETQEQMI